MHELHRHDIDHVFQRSKRLVEKRAAVAKARGVELLVGSDSKQVHGIERNRAPDAEFIARRIRRGLRASGSAAG